jgi:hypothetical protein
MRAAELLVPPFADKLASGIKHNSPNHRIRLDESAAASG